MLLIDATCNSFLGGAKLKTIYFMSSTSLSKSAAVEGCISLSSMKATPTPNTGKDLYLLAFSGILLRQTHLVAASTSSSSAFLSVFNLKLGILLQLVGGIFRKVN
ncbi:hypothetical protein L6452_37383 [Arctium lappa]|uniref:Uncharacterized protein n=1 Tax=Arctium lappa TaxID=4217 RepID=A0ACB8Y3K1_ARCLA|nr:hypothetical protein L6452_37383 [Arctium lappa]